MRGLAAALLIGLVLAPAGHAKLKPTFSERVVEAGDAVEFDVGEGSEQFLGPLRIYLVPLEAVDPPRRSPAFSNRVKSESDPRLVRIGELGTAGEFGTPRVLRFQVPDLPAGDYTAAIWFKGYSTGTWANALEGINPLLTIRAADERGASPAQSDGQTRSPLWALAFMVGGLGAGLVA